MYWSDKLNEIERQTIGGVLSVLGDVSPELWMKVASEVSAGFERFFEAAEELCDKEMDAAMEDRED